MGQRRHVIVKNTEALLEHAVYLWGRICNDAVRQRGRCSIALSGGLTPRILFKKITSGAASIPWENTDIFIVDERFVPFTHPDNNFRMMDEFLFTPCGIDRSRIHPVPVDKHPLDNAVRAYEDKIKKVFMLAENKLPVFDLVMLGMGTDGHTASLFPGTAALRERARVAVGVPEPSVNHNRISLTLPVINKARNVMFLVTGAHKAHAVYDILRRQSSESAASQVQLDDGELYFLVDKEAGAMLKQGEELL